MHAPHVKLSPDHQRISCAHCGTLSSDPSARIPDHRRAVLIAEFLRRHERCVPDPTAWQPALETLTGPMRVEVLRHLDWQTAASPQPRTLRLCPSPEAIDPLRAWDLLSEEVPEQDRRLELV